MLATGWKGLRLEQSAKHGGPSATVDGGHHGENFPLRQQPRGVDFFPFAINMSTKPPKANELRAQSKTELTKQLEDLKQELASLRVQKVAGGSASKLTRIATVRKSIARVLTVTTSLQRNALRNFYKDKKYLPLDLRPKKTRAQRRALPKKDAERITVRTAKKLRAFPEQKYALRK